MTGGIPGMTELTALPATRQELADILTAANQAWGRGDVDAALAGFRRVAMALPSQGGAHVNLGVALRKIGKVQAAATAHRRALALLPDDPVVLSNLANALRDLGQLREAELHARRALILAPGTPTFRYNLALLLRDCRQYDESDLLLAGLEKEFPDNGDYAWDLALSRLYRLDYAAGFAGYEARWRLARSGRRPLPGPSVRPGDDLTGKTVFVAAEQGFGDALQFARFLPVLAGRCARLVVECQPELIDLFATMDGVAQVVPKGGPVPAHDVWVPIMSLAWVLGVTPADLPGAMPYLRPVRPGPRLDRAAGVVLKVGLIWAGKTVPRDRSWPLTDLLPLLDDPRLAFHSLQMGPRAADLAELGIDHLVHDLGPSLSSFADTASIMAGLDVVVTIDTSAAHLAGALGRPTLMLLRHVSDWRWLDKGETCLWYPSMRLFRQDHPDDFSGPVERLRQLLIRLADERQTVQEKTGCPPAGKRV